MAEKPDPSKPTAAFYELRKLAITAMFSDDVLMERLVLKGGNALDIVLGIGGRTSRDIDFSIEGGLSDFDDIRRRIERVIKDRFDSAGCEVLDLASHSFPTEHRDGGTTDWAGCMIEFKVIKKALYEASGTDKSATLKSAETVGPKQEKRLTIQISSHEYTAGKIEVELDHIMVVVYTPIMIALEKLRAICQQMP